MARPAAAALRPAPDPAPAPETAFDPGNGGGSSCNEPWSSPAGRPISPEPPKKICEQQQVGPGRAAGASRARHGAGLTGQPATRRCTGLRRARSRRRGRHTAPPSARPARRCASARDRGAVAGGHWLQAEDTGFRRGTLDLAGERRDGGRGRATAQRRRTESRSARRASSTWPTGGPRVGARPSNRCHRHARFAGLASHHERRSGGAAILAPSVHFIRLPAACVGLCSVRIRALAVALYARRSLPELPLCGQRKPWAICIVAATAASADGRPAAPAARVPLRTPGHCHQSRIQALRSRRRSPARPRELLARAAIGSP